MSVSFAELCLFSPIHPERSTIAISVIQLCEIWNCGQSGESFQRRSKSNVEWQISAILWVSSAQESVPSCVVLPTLTMIWHPPRNNILISLSLIPFYSSGFECCKHPVASCFAPHQVLVIKSSWGTVSCNAHYTWAQLQAKSTPLLSAPRDHLVLFQVTNLSCINHTVADYAVWFTRVSNASEFMHGAAKGNMLIFCYKRVYSNTKRTQAFLVLIWSSFFGMHASVETNRPFEQSWVLCMVF